MKVVRVVALGATLLAAGCAYPGPEKRQLYDSLVGRSSADVVRALGVPTQIMTVENSQFLDYAQTTSSYVSSPGLGWGGGWRGGWRGGWAGGYGGWGGYASYYQDTCRTTFEARQDRVVAWTTHDC